MTETQINHPFAKQHSTDGYSDHPVRCACPKNILGAITASLLCLAPITPSAQALTFGDGYKATNPFFYNGTSADSSWTFAENGTVQSDWSTGDTPGCSMEDGLCVTAINPSGIKIAGGSNPGETTALTSGSASNPYSVSFFWAFDEITATANPFYEINGTKTNLLGLTGSVNSQTLNAGSSLSFGITNVDGFGDLTISNFSATKLEPVLVPGPLPILGAAAAFGWSRRLRSRLRRHQRAR